MKRFWSDLISSLYSIRDGIIKKKQEDEAEKEELRNQIAELEENSNSQDSIVVEPFAMFQTDNEGKILKSFDKSFIDYGSALALYKIEDFEQANNNNNSLPVDDAVVPNSDNLSLKDNKIYFLKISPELLYNPNSESDTYSQFLETNSDNLYSHYDVVPFVKNGQAFDYLKANDYIFSLESFRIEGLEVEDLNNLYFIIGTNIS